MSIVSIITARGGSKSIYKKNIIECNGLPLLAYPLKASQNSKYISEVFVDTDCESIIEVSKYFGAKIINRPEYLSGDTINHGDVIRNSCKEVLKIKKVDIFVILLGNTVMIDSDLIDESLRLLINDKDATGVCSVWRAADDHPQRAMELKEGYLYSHSSVIPQKDATTDRSSYKPAFFYDQGVWAFKSKNLEKSKGPATWNWLGDKVIPLERPWITGRDINGPFDFNFHKQWDSLKKTPKDFKIKNLSQ